MIAFLVFLFVLVGSPFVGATIIAVVLLCIPGKFVHTRGPQPVHIIGVVALLALLALFLLLIGAWMLIPFCAFAAGGMLALPLCWKYAAYLDALQDFLWTPQQAGMRKETTPYYPKSEPMPVPVQEESMMMVYYSE